MAQEERFLGIRIRYQQKPEVFGRSLPFAKGKSEVTRLTDKSGQIRDLGEIHISQIVNQNVTGKISVKNGTTFEQPGRIPKTKLSGFNGKNPVWPFSLSSGECLILEKGGTTVKVVNRR